MEIFQLYNSIFKSLNENKSGNSWHFLIKISFHLNFIYTLILNGIWFSSINTKPFYISI
jgi:hypothetical protein